MPEIRRFIPGLPPARDPGRRVETTPRPAGGAVPPLSRTGLEPIPDRRPDLGTLDRPTVDQVVEEVVQPAFVKSELVSPGNFEAMLKEGARLLAGGDAAMRLAAATVKDALDDRDIVEACRLFLIKG